MYTLKVKKINEDAIIPAYAHKGDAGMDLYSTENIEIPPSETRLVHTGIQIELPPNTEAQVRPRSGLALKHSITVLNTPGTVDEGYRGEIMIILINHGKEAFNVEKGMRIAQMVIKPTLMVDIKQVEELDGSERGNNGFGSSGLK